MAVQDDAAADASPAVEIRYATAADADALALLSQELLAFYGLPVRYQRSYMAHVIADKAFTDPPSIQILMAFQRGQARGFLAFSHSFALANCLTSVFIQDLFVTRKARAHGIGRLMMTDWRATASNRGSASSTGPPIRGTRRQERSTRPWGRCCAATRPTTESCRPGLPNWPPAHRPRRHVGAESSRSTALWEL
jgi:GNAT superfamily N-acetyltransferase